MIPVCKFPQLASFKLLWMLFSQLVTETKKAKKWKKYANDRVYYEAQNVSDFPAATKCFCLRVSHGSSLRFSRLKMTLSHHPQKDNLCS